MTAISRTLAAPVPQTEPLDERQVENSAGGFVYAIDPIAHFDRFLILGTAGGTYYASERKLTREGMALCAKLANDLKPEEYASRVILAGNTAPKRTYAIYAIAAALIHGGDQLRSLAPTMAREVCKTGTDVFELASYVKGNRGWGATVQKTFDQFLDGKDAKALGLWAVKYRSRHGWTWRDLVRMQHPTKHDALYGFMCGKEEHVGIPVVDGYLAVQGMTDEAEIIETVSKYGLPWEALADDQRTPAVWKACLPFIGDWAVLRNLASFSRKGMTQDREFLLDVEGRINGSHRVHPITMLEALRTYGAGGALGRSRAADFHPEPLWLAALDRTLEESFTSGVERTNQNVLVAIDVSGSMSSMVSGSFVLSCRDVATVLGLAFLKNEPFCKAIAFSDGRRTNFGARGATTPLAWSPRTTFSEAMRSTQNMPFAGTDCAAPMVDALGNKVLNIDTFIVITDNETWAGKVHPMVALDAYRKASGRNSKLAVVGLTATNFSIADPADPGTMDFVGFSSDLPKALASFMAMT